MHKHAHNTNDSLFLSLIRIDISNIDTLACGSVFFFIGSILYSLLSITIRSSL